MTDILVLFTWICGAVLVFTLAADFVYLVLIKGKSLKEFDRICGEKYK